MGILPRNQKHKKQSPFVAIFSHPNSNEDKKKTTKKQGLHPSSLSAIFIRPIKMKAKTKISLTVRLFVVLCAIFDCHIRMKTKQIRKKTSFPLTMYGGTLNVRSPPLLLDNPRKCNCNTMTYCNTVCLFYFFACGCVRKKYIYHYHRRPNLNSERLTTDVGTSPSYNYSTGYISIDGLWPCFITTTPLRCEINISC